MNYKSLDIHDIWNQMLNGDDQALTELVIRFEPVIRAESTINGHLNEDVSQEIRERFVQAMKSLRPPTGV